MEKAEENIGTSNVENENVELNLGLSLNVILMWIARKWCFKSQQPPTQGNYIAKGKIKNFMLNHMTFVSTRGKGPNGKKTEGLLYPCNKKDEVEIVFLCHGDLLNAAEFVEHASGGYVEHPLNHIFIDGE
ncbi:ninja-family protein AFP3-like [Solanum tuberosum]|uniref:ninja-family protein AFP3-like n=1 Tax=Solanum tuberosum TaxID=4113 RepID=UPI00073A092A|nr:PREDICTED: ninja-family protein AFP3-like [Solanum tuberosum]